MKVHILISAITILLIGIGCTQIPASSKQNTNDTNTVIVTGPRLDLSNSGLTKLPADVLKRTDLVELNISNNELTGALPGEIRFLLKLKILDASDNQMTGVPAEVGQLTKLLVLDLSNNRLTGLPNELGNLTQLQTLDLRGNAYSKLDLDGIRAKLPNTNIIVDQI